MEHLSDVGQGAYDETRSQFGTKDKAVQVSDLYLSSVNFQKPSCIVNSIQNLFINRYPFYSGPNTITPNLSTN